MGWSVEVAKEKKRSRGEFDEGDGIVKERAEGAQDNCKHDWQAGRCVCRIVPSSPVNASRRLPADYFTLAVSAR